MSNFQAIFAPLGSRDPELKKWQRHFRKVDDGLIDADAAALGDDANGSGGSGDNSNTSRHISHLADLIVEAKPGVTRSEALDWLLHTKSGQALVARTKRFKQQQERQMPESFEKMVADMGIKRIAKAVVERGHSAAISEREFTEAVTALAVRDARAGESRAQAFSRVFCANDETGITLRKACAIIKNAPMMVLVEPVQVDKATADPEDALAALNKLAEEEARRNPALSTSQAFAKVYAANPRLAQAERTQNRPRATAIYQSGQ